MGIKSDKDVPAVCPVCSAPIVFLRRPGAHIDPLTGQAGPMYVALAVCDREDGHYSTFVEEVDEARFTR